MKVILSYYQRPNKYMGRATYNSDKTTNDDIFFEVKEMQTLNKLPRRRGDRIEKVVVMVVEIVNDLEKILGLELINNN